MTIKQSKFPRPRQPVKTETLRSSKDPILLALTSTCSWSSWEDRYFGETGEVSPVGSGALAVCWASSCLPESRGPPVSEHCRPSRVPLAITTNAKGMICLHEGRECPSAQVIMLRVGPTAGPEVLEKVLPVLADCLLPQPHPSQTPSFTQSSSRLTPRLCPLAQHARPGSLGFSRRFLIPHACGSRRAQASEIWVRQTPGPRAHMKCLAPCLACF